MTSLAVAKAVDTKKNAAKGTHQKKKRVYTRVQFHRPRTLKL